jgi:hypothetical protein
MSLTLRRAFGGENSREGLQGLKEALDARDPGQLLIPLPLAIDLVIGSEAKRGAAWDWDNPVLNLVCSASREEELLDAIETLPTVMEKGDYHVDYDAVFDLIFDAFLEGYEQAQKRLKDAFTVFDEDENGLELPEFKVMLSDVCKANLQERDINRHWKAILACEPEEYGNDDGAFEHAELFAVACCQRGEQCMPHIGRPATPTPEQLQKMADMRAAAEKEAARSEA